MSEKTARKSKMEFHDEKGRSGCRKGVDGDVRVTNKRRLNVGWNGTGI